VRVPDARLPKRRFTSDATIPECPQLRFVRIDGSLFYGAVAHVAEQLRRLADQPGAPRDLALVASGINFIDIAGAELLVQEAKRRQRNGSRLYLLRPNRKVIALLERGGYVDAIGRDNVFNSKGDGIAAAFSRFDPAVCAGCPRRVFAECETVAR
jgi:SulP family sulfate permease